MKIPKIKKITKPIRRTIRPKNTVRKKKAIPKSCNTVINEEWQDPMTGGFREGNPGRPKGSVNKRTAFINAMMECFGPAEIKVFKQFFRTSNYKYLAALDRIVSVASIGGKGNQVDPESLPPFQVIIEGDNEPAAKT
jgi:hypothetical protein